ncbi:cation channel sperm-associated auxiliary subunit delta [Antechinus flavipes]|uniref:cation channel sperm-associated auxiliary subunit delta n=1 Tax=Antechinus flavipes TaxID=38775 RepID=UPI002235530F|nr:cation channel sperm-associated auxiliary subunit delta [Antechinus flavipes]
MVLTGLSCPLGFSFLPVVVTVVLSQDSFDIPVCSYELIETGKSEHAKQYLIENILYYAYKDPQIIKHPCNQKLALYMGKRLFLTKDNFRRSLTPLNIPYKFKVGIPKVTSAIFSSSKLLLAINGNVFGYDYEDDSWIAILDTQEQLANIYAEYCCYSDDYSCTSISNLVLVYTTGEHISKAHVYLSNSLGFHFEKLELPQMKTLDGILEGFFFFHSMSKYAMLLRTGKVGRFVYTEPPLNESWGMPFEMSGHINIINLSDLKGYLILWDEKHLFFTNNCGQLVEEIPIKNDKGIKYESLAHSLNQVSSITGFENELALLTKSQKFFYGTLGLLSTSLIDIEDDGIGLKEAAIMFESVGNILIVVPEFFYQDPIFDFSICPLNIQYLLMDLEIGLKTCKAEILRGNFNKKLFVLDMNETLKLSATLVPQPSQSPVPVITVSNPHSLGFKVKMYEDGYTYDGNTIFTIDIFLMQQHVSGRAHGSFISNMKTATLSTITLDLIDRGMSCIDLQPQIGLISIGCNWNKRIIIRRDLTACMKNFLKPEELEDNYTYILEKTSYDGSYHSRKQPNNKDLIVEYEYERLGCPLLVYYNSPWKPVIELWKESNFVEVVKTEFILIERNGLFTYNYSLTVGKALCKSQAQSWSSMIDASSKKDLNAWNRENYVNCHEHNEKAPLLSPQAEYQILGGSTSNSIIFNQRNGIYIFLLRIVDPYYSYCDLTTVFSVYVYGAFPKQTLPDYIVALLIICFMLFLLWLGYFIPKLTKSQYGNRFKLFCRNLCPRSKEKRGKFHITKLKK